MTTNKIRRMGRLIAKYDDDAAKYFLENANTYAKNIAQAFVWKDTPQGQDFWSQMYEKVHGKQDVR